MNDRIRQSSHKWKQYTQRVSENCLLKQTDPKEQKRCAELELGGSIRTVCIRKKKKVKKKNEKEEKEKKQTPEIHIPFKH